MPDYTIALARSKDLTQLPVIELAAAQLLRGHAPESVLNETTGDNELQKAHRDGHLWVVLAGDAPVGFAHVKLIDNAGAHLDELDVLPAHGRRGLGTRLVTHVCDWAAAGGYASVTLTTFRDVPWNMPFYERLGFQVVPTEELSPALRSCVEDETRRGLDPTRRVVMRRACELNPTPVNPTVGDVEYLEERIYEFNSRATGIDDGQWLAFFVREGDRIVAGICGNTWGGTCELRQFWVEESRRGRGIGTTLLHAAEQEARRRGCTQIALMTFSFQAPRFYERNGFEVVATVDAHPRGHANLLMRKSLAAT